MPDAPASDRRPDWRRLLLLGVAGAAAFGAFAFVALGGGGAAPPAPPTQRDDGTEPPRGPRDPTPDEVLAGAASVYREVLEGYEDPQPAAGYARGIVQRAFATDVYEDAAIRDALIDALGSEDWTRRQVALLAAPYYGPADGRFAKLLVLRALDEEPSVRDTAVQVIAGLREPDAEALALLQRARPTLDPPARGAVLRALLRGRRDRTKALALEALRDDPPVEVRRAASWGLATLDLTPTTPYPHDDLRAPLLVLLADEDGLVRMNAAQALGRMGHEAGPAVDALVASLSDPEPYVAGHASAALANVGAAAYAPLGALLREGDREAADDVVWVLRQLGGPEATRILREAMSHDDALIRVRAASGLYALGAEPGDVRDTLADALGQTGDVAVLIAATNALGALGKEAAPARVALEALRAHPDPTVRRAVANLLSAL